MKTILYSLLIWTLLLCSCSSSPTTMEIDNFDIKKYKGYKVLYKCDYGQSNYKDFYVLRNDTTAVELRVPSWFKEIYNIGDTIK